MDTNIKLYQGNCFTIFEELLNKNIHVDAIICDPHITLNMINGIMNLIQKKLLNILQKYSSLMVI